MDTIQVLDKKFRISIPEEEILKRVDAVAEKINRDMAGKNPLFIAILNGAFIFAADLLRRITIPCEISFVKLASYQGTATTGKVTEVFGITESLNGRTIIIIEDIVETGLTLRRMLESIGTRNPESVHICTFLFKPEKLKVDLDIEYVAIRIPNDFVLGYGLDYDQQGRGLRDLYTLVPEEDNKTNSNKMKNIVIFGAPGSGKGTQSDLLIEKYGLNHISTGDVLRAEIKNGTELGKIAKEYIDQGQLVPDSLIVDMLAGVYDSFGAEHKGVIFDGFPRTVPQAEALKEMLAKRGHCVAAMIELDVPEDELMTRLLKRGQESGRSDDNEETIRKRLTVYHNQTSPLIDWYEKEGLRHQINGLGALDRIFGDIAKVVENL
jgi:adenylate kinase